MYRIIVECDRARTVEDALRVQPQPKPCGNIAGLPRELSTAARTAMAIIVSCTVPHCHSRPSRLQNLRDLMPCNHQFTRLVSFIFSTHAGPGTTLAHIAQALYRMHMRLSTLAAPALFRPGSSRVESSQVE